MTKFKTEKRPQLHLYIPQVLVDLIKGKADEYGLGLTEFIIYTLYEEVRKPRTFYEIKIINKQPRYENIDLEHEYRDNLEE